MIDLDDILEVIFKFCEENEMSVSKYAFLAGVSKSWISRLSADHDKKISLQLAQQLLNVSGYKLKIVNSSYTINKCTRLGRKI